MNEITNEMLVDIWAESEQDMDAACQLLEQLLFNAVSPAEHYDERNRCRPILAAMRDAQSP